MPFEEDELIAAKQAFAKASALERKAIGTSEYQLAKDNLDDRLEDLNEVRERQGYQGFGYVR